jgi:hypothetical protein
MCVALVEIFCGPFKHNSSDNWLKLSICATWDIVVPLSTIQVINCYNGSIISGESLHESGTKSMIEDSDVSLHGIDNEVGEVLVMVRVGGIDDTC